MSLALQMGLAGDGYGFIRHDLMTTTMMIMLVHGSSLKCDQIDPNILIIIASNKILENIIIFSKYKNIENVKYIMTFLIFSIFPLFSIFSRK